MERARIAKAARTFVRLKHSLAADEELNAVLPDTLEEFDRALASGTLKTFSLADALDELS